MLAISIILPADDIHTLSVDKDLTDDMVWASKNLLSIIVRPVSRQNKCYLRVMYVTTISLAILIHTLSVDKEISESPN